MLLLVAFSWFQLIKIALPSVILCTFLHNAGFVQGIPFANIQYTQRNFNWN